MNEIDEERLQLMGLRRTHLRGRPRKGQWYLSQHGDLLRAALDSDKSAFSDADVVELLEVDVETAAVITLHCPKCGRAQTSSFVGWEPHQQTYEIVCGACP
jgi:hypothetical protein